MPDNIVKRIYRYTKKQHEEAIKLYPIYHAYSTKANNRKPWKVTRWTRRNPLVLLSA